MSLFRAALPLFLLAPLFGCPDEATDPMPFEPPPDANVGADAVAADVSADDAAADAGPDGAVTPPDAEIPGPACRYPADCAMGDCVDGLCRFAQPARCLDGAPCPEGERCGGFTANYYCRKPCEEEQSCPQRVRPCERHVDCTRGSSCHDGRCINDCETDLDCPEEGYCVDGECQVYPEGILGGDAPEPLTEEPLLAGVAVIPMEYPMGVSMAGYGAREGPRTPYAVSMGGSDRVLELVDVRVLVLATPEDTVIVLRLPLGWSTDFIHTLTAQKLQDLTGVDYSTKIITSATHSHSQPGRYWNLVPETMLGFFGHGQFSQAIHERYTTSFARAIKQALDNLQPARFGYTILDDFDPQRHIHSDRRGESPELLDDRMLVWRVEALDGTPLAGLVNFAIHGTHMNETWLTGDVAGGIERVLSDRLSARYDRFVPIMFMNGNAGDVSPRGDASVRPSWGKIQVLGGLVWPVFEPAWDAVEMRDAPKLEVVHKRIPVGYDQLGYDQNAMEFRDRLGNTQRYGAFQCVMNGLAADEPDYEDGNLRCLIDLQAFLGAPSMPLQKTVLAAFRLDDLVVTTLPGEPTSQLGLELSQAIEADARNAGEEVRVVQFGYSMDHLLYLVLEDDWFRGGYEAAQGVWGWRLGRYLFIQSQALAGQLFTNQKENNDSDIKPSWFPKLIPDKVDPTPTEGAGTVVTDVPDTLQRGGMVDFQWAGGHPEVDLPRVVLQHDEGAGFQPFMRNAQVFDDGGFESLTFYRGDYAENHDWAGRWELPFDLPLGRYRWVVSGRYFDGAETQPYTVELAPFELEPAKLTLREVVVEDGQVAAKVNYPDGPTNAGEDGWERLEPRGHLLRLRPERRFNGVLREYAFILGESLPPEHMVSVRLSGAADVDVMVDPFEDAVSFDLATGPAQNTRIEGWPATRVELTAPVPGEYTFTVEDAWGNVGTAEVTVE